MKKKNDWSVWDPHMMPMSVNLSESQAWDQFLSSPWGSSLYRGERQVSSKETKTILGKLIP
jgi:hypothetical protein